MAKLQKYRLIEDKPVSRTRLMLDAIRGIWTGPLTANSPELAHLWGGRPSATGVTITEATALTYSAVWAAVTLISTQVGNLPCVLWRKEGRGKQKFETHPLYRLIHDRPNPNMSAFVFRETLQAHVLLWGNAYAEIVRNGAGRPAALWPITPDRVTPERNASGLLTYRVRNEAGGDVSMPAADMLHIPGLSYDGICGYSVIQKARESIGLGIAAERFGGTFFGNGSSFGGVFSYPGPRPPEMADKNYRDAINSQHQGIDRAHKFIALYNGAKYERLGIPPNDAQFLETRQFQVDEIARWFNIPTHKLKELANGANRSTTEEGNIEYLVDCLGPWLERWEQELSEKLIAPSERNLQTIEFIADGVLRGDIVARGDFHTKRFSTASATPNDLRALENENPIEGGDDAFVAFNLAPLPLARPYWQASIDEKLAQIELIKAQAKKAAEPTPVPTQPMPPTREQLDAIVAEIREHDADLERLTQAEARADTFQREGVAFRAALEAERDAHQRSTEAFSLDLTAITIERDEARVRAATAEAVRDELRGQVTQREVTLTAEREAHQRSTEAFSLDVTAITQERDDARTRADTAEAVRDELRGQLQETDGLLAKTAAAQVTADTERQRLAQALELALAQQIGWTAQAASWAESRTQVLAALRLVLAHEGSCLVARESDRARKAQRSPEKLAQWATDFYPLHEDYCRDGLRAAVQAWAVAAGVADVPARLDATIPAYLEDGRRQIQALAAESDVETLSANLEKLLRRWETARVDALVTALTKEPV